MCQLKTSRVDIKDMKWYIYCEWIERMYQMVQYKTKSRENQNLRACILYDGCTCILLTVWDKLLNPVLKELSVWYMCTDVNMKNQIGIKLTTTSLPTAEECATADKLHIN